MNSKLICGEFVPAYGFVFLTGLFLLSGCSTSLHGSFIAQSYTGHGDSETTEKLGLVEGRSCQTQPLYILALGDPATTDAAIKDAQNKIEKTRFLADISIDDETKWSIGYSVQCIVARATAYQ
jgi:hypothetical protein